MRQKEREVAVGRLPAFYLRFIENCCFVYMARALATELLLSYYRFYEQDNGNNESI